MNEKNELPQVVALRDLLETVRHVSEYEGLPGLEAEVLADNRRILRDYLAAYERATTSLSTLTAQGGEVVRNVVVDSQGVRFGDYFWASHERITGRSAKQLNEGAGVVSQQYMKWLAGEAQTYTTPPAPSSSAVEGELRKAAEIVCMAAAAKNVLAIMRGCERLSKALASTVASGHAWQADPDVPGKLYCPRCDVTRSDAGGHGECIPAPASTAASGGDKSVAPSGAEGVDRVDHAIALATIESLRMRLSGCEAALAQRDEKIATLTRPESTAGGGGEEDIRIRKTGSGWWQIRFGRGAIPEVYKSALDGARDVVRELEKDAPTAQGGEAVRNVVVDSQGVRFGEYFWASHERITGRSAQQLNSGAGVVSQQYMKWLAGELSDGSIHPTIDFLRYTPEEIEQALRRRAAASAQGDGDGWDYSTESIPYDKQSPTRSGEDGDE